MQDTTIMEWLDDYEPPPSKRPLWQRILIFGGLYGALPVICIAGIVLLCVLIPIHHRRNRDHATIKSRTFNVSYLVFDDMAVAVPLFNINTIDYTQLSRTFQATLNLPSDMTLKVEHVHQSLADQSSTSCDFFFSSTNDLLLKFELRLDYTLHPCRNQSCQNESDTGIYQRLVDVAYFTVNLGDDITELYLCSIDEFPNIKSISSTLNKSNHVSEEPVTYTAATSTLSPRVCNASNSSAERSRWVPVGNMSAPRMSSQSTYIPTDNYILITGGSADELHPSDTIQKYLIANRSFAVDAFPSLKVKRLLQTADLLPLSGALLLTGTTLSASTGQQPSAELFNPVTGEIRSIAMIRNRRYHTSTVIPSTDDVVLIGGEDGSSAVLSTGDLFHGARFVPITNLMTTKRIYHTATYIPRLNKILIVGGRDHEFQTQNTSQTVELYDVATNRFEALPNVSMSTARARHTATYIPPPAEKIVIIGGENDQTQYLDSCEVFDVGTMSFVGQGSIAYGRSGHHAIMLNDQKNILIADGVSGSVDIAPSELFHVEKLSACQVTAMNTPRDRFALALLPKTGEVLACGGRDTTYVPLNSCELYTSLEV